MTQSLRGTNSSLGVVSGYLYGFVMQLGSCNLEHAKYTSLATFSINYGQCS